MMNLYKHRDRQRLLARLLGGPQSDRQREAVGSWHLIDAGLDAVRRRKEQAHLQYCRLQETMGRQGSTPAIHPHTRLKAVTFGLFAPPVALVELCLAFLTARATIDGTATVHILAAVAAAVLFTGIGKLAITATLDTARLADTIRRLERQLVWACGASGLLLALFFFLRFTRLAELSFALATTGLSFTVAWIVSLSWTLASLHAAPERAARRYHRLVEIEAEIVRLHAIAAELCRTPAPEEVAKTPQPRSAGLVAALVLSALLLPAARADEKALSIWVDVSGSVDEAEFARLEALLADPVELLEGGEFGSLALTPFWDEHHALRGAEHRWSLPVPEIPACGSGTASPFTFSRRSKEEACQKQEEQARAQWRDSLNEVLTEYRDRLSAADVTTERERTCLWPLLRRVALSSLTDVHLILTDGAHHGCGPPPDEPLVGAATAIIILLPDNGGAGLIDRMEQRTELLNAHYPTITVIPSWKVQSDIGFLVKR